MTARFIRAFLLCYKRVVVWPLRITYTGVLNVR